MDDGSTPIAGRTLRERKPGDAAEPRLSELDRAVERAAKALLGLQHADGYWCFELEADCTIPAEYILMTHYLGEIDERLERKLASYLRAHQADDGGWPLYYGGSADLSCSVKAYYALKLAGDSPDLPHMARARETILRLGGASRSNVFTRIALAMFEQLPWRAVPFLPVECMLLPHWFPFHLSKISYWSRTVMVPLFILYAFRARARNPKQVSVRELFVRDPWQETDYFPARSALNRAFLVLDRLGLKLEPWIPQRLRRRAIKEAEAWILERLNGEGGLGAIFPAMVNAYEVMDLLGYAASDPRRAQARRAIEDLLVIEEDSAYCQPCVSPVWDTVWSCIALEQAGDARSRAAANKALDWLAARQLLDGPQDWRFNRPQIRSGGWPFQFKNSHYPDLDDTAAVAYAMHKNGDRRFENAVQRAAEWICGMQSRNGGFASFDADNDHVYLNEIPFADHGALLDPPTEDVSGRCAMLLARLRSSAPCRAALERCLEYLFRCQAPDGAWYGRWGTNYIYGTWSVLMALEEAGIDPRSEAVRRAGAWLKSVQRADGGWGEGNDTYFDPSRRGRGQRSTSFHTAWAVLGLMSAGEVNCDAVRAGIRFLLSTQRPDGLWKDPEFNAPGFPRVFYLKYHGYDKYFPLLALARYRNLIAEKG
ncbi:MAG TPA: squalene--hopene cyclase [Candidatus Acidoferrales bacterium]|nr:squalene--hopene cyclase [Candidatus Acidoferrales bacterium]